MLDYCIVSINSSYQIIWVYMAGPWSLGYHDSYTKFINPSNDYHTKSRVRSTSSIFQSDQVQIIDLLRWVSENQNVTLWMSPWPQWGLKWCDQLRGEPAVTHIGKWKDWGEGVQWYDPGQWGWPGHGGSAVKFTVIFISHLIIININTMLLTWGLENIRKCKQHLQVSDQSSSGNKSHNQSHNHTTKKLKN